MSEPQSPPALRVVRGEPTAEELAVLTALVSATGGGGDTEPEAPTRGRWNDPAAQHRGPWLTGPGAWRSATRR